MMYNSPHVVPTASSSDWPAGQRGGSETPSTRPLVWLERVLPVLGGCVYDSRHGAVYGRQPATALYGGSNSVASSTVVLD